MEDKIIDPESIAAIDEVIKKIEDLEKKIDEANEKAIIVQVELKGADSIAAYTSAIENQKAALTDLQDAQQEAQSLTNRFGQAQVQAAQQAVNASNSLKELQRQLTEVNKQWEASGRASADAAQRIGEIKSEIAQITPQVDQYCSAMKNVAEAMINVGSNADASAKSFETILDVAGDLISKFTGFGSVVAIFIKIVESIYDVSNAAEKASESLNTYKNTVNETGNSALQDYEKEMDKVKQLFDIIQDKNLSYSFRMDSLEKLVDIYPDMLTNMEKEAYLSGEILEKYEIIERVQSNLSLIKRRQADVDEDTRTLNDLKKASEKITEYDAKKENEEEIKKLRTKIDDAKQRIADTWTAIFSYLHPAHEGRLLSDIDAEIKQNELLRDNNTADSPTHKDAIEQLKKLAEEKRKYLGGEDNDKKPVKDPRPGNKRQMDAELKIAEDNRQIQHRIALKQYNDSKQTDADKLQLLQQTVAIEDDYKRQEFAILDKWAGKTGETQEQELARRKDYEKKYADLDAKALETRRRIQDEINAEYARADNANKQYIATLEETDRKIAELTARRNESLATYQAYMQTSGAVHQDEWRQQDDENSAIDNARVQQSLDSGLMQQAQQRLEHANLAVQVQEVTPDGHVIPMEARDYETYNAALKEKNDALKAHEDLRVKLIQDADAVIAAEQAKNLNEADRRNNRQLRGQFPLLEQGVQGARGAQESARRADDEQGRLAGPLSPEFIKQQQDDIAHLEKQAEQDRLQALMNFGQQSIEVYQQIFEAWKQIQDNKIAAEEQQLQIEMKQVQLQSQQQIAAINATAGFQITKENEAAQVVAQTTALENQIQQQQNNLQLKKAIADKKAAEASVIMNTAKAIMGVWAAEAPLFPEGLALAAAETVLIAGIGAAQYAAAASTPLPQFAQGGITSTPFFVAGEGGRPELMRTPGGDTSLISKEGIYAAPIGTEIVPLHRMMERAQANVLRGDYSDYAALQAHAQNAMIAEELARIYNGARENADDMSHAIVKAIYNNNRKPVHVTVAGRNALQRKG